MSMSVISELNVTHIFIKFFYSKFAIFLSNHLYGLNIYFLSYMQIFCGVLDRIFCYLYDACYSKLFNDCGLWRFYFTIHTLFK